VLVYLLPTLPGVTFVARYIVSGGKFTAILPGRSAIALFTGALGTGSSGGGEGGVATVVFRVYTETTPEEVSMT
jgi:hypothetical protein